MTVDLVELVSGWEAPGIQDGPGVAVLDVETHDERRLDNPSPDCDWTWVPAFSPDGRSLAVVCVKDMDVYEVFVLPVSGRSAARKVLRAEAVVDSPGRPEPFGGGLAVSADGRNVLFSQRDEVASDIMLVENFDSR